MEKLQVIKGSGKQIIRRRGCFDHIIQQTMAWEEKGQRKMWIRLVAIIAVFVLAGCATAPRLGTPSGYPEIMINGVSKKQVADEIVNQLVVEKGGWVRSSNDYCLVIGKVNMTMLGAMFLGTPLAPRPEDQVAFSMFDVSGGIKITVTASIVSNAGTGFEIPVQTTNADLFQSLQDFLEMLKRKMETPQQS
jgi:hypothetical protein